MCKYCDFQYTACHAYMKFIIVVLFWRRVHDYYVIVFVQNIMFQLDVRPRYVKTFLLTLYYVVILYCENHEIKGFFGGGYCNSQNKIFLKTYKFGQKERDKLCYSFFNTIFLFNSVTEYLIYTVVIIVLFMKW